MKIARLAILVVGFLLVGGGYLASILYYNSDQQASFYARIDQPPIVMLSLVLLVGAIAVGLLSKNGEQEES